MDSANHVVLEGMVSERADFSETGDGHPVAEFWLKYIHRWTGRSGQSCDSETYVRCRATGYPANSIRKCWYPGVNVTLVGQLRQRTFPKDGGGTGSELYLFVHSLSYVSPRQVSEAIAKAIP